MSVQQKIDKVLEIVREQVQKEVGALMGAEFYLVKKNNWFAKKEGYFVDLSGKKVIAKMDIAGDIESLGALVIGIKDAIRLGGTLIMLPQSELNEVVGSENYTEEAEDSFGEIANIIAGSYTKVFEDMYPESYRFVRKEQEVVEPLKVDVASAEPFPDQWYYVIRSSMLLNGLEMGDLDMLVPALPFKLEVPEQEQPTAEDEQSAEQIVVDTTQKTAPETHREKQSQQPAETILTETQQSPNEKKSAPIKSLEKHRKLVDSLLNSSNEILAKEVGALLGVSVQLKDSIFKPVSKEQFLLEETSGKQVLAHMDAVDKPEGSSYLFIGIKDAIRIGSILIMLPPSELEVVVSEETLTPDTEDAYGEIANIISGAYTKVFQDQYITNIRFVKTDLETVTPLKVDIESDEVIPHQRYYMSKSSIHIDGQQYGYLSMLVPLAFLQLDALMLDQQVVSEASGDTALDDATESLKTTHASGSLQSSPKESDLEAVEILVIENDRSEAEKILTELQRMGIATRSVGYNDNLSYHLNSQLRLVIIVMQEVDEQAFGVTIKVNSHTSIPIVAASSLWTKTKVIKAVKYGVSDIILTPASPNDIQDKIQANMAQLAA